MIYEKEENREAEMAAAFAVAQEIDCEYLMTRTLADVDLLFFRGLELRAIAEHKGRDKQYPSVFLEVAKYNKLRALSEGLKTRALFIVTFPSGVYYVDPIKLMPMEVESVLRTDRAGETPDDCYLVPVDQMKKVAGDPYV